MEDNDNAQVKEQSWNKLLDFGISMYQLVSGSVVRYVKASTLQLGGGFQLNVLFLRGPAQPPIRLEQGSPSQYISIWPISSAKNHL